jgi:hypothetical protein
MNEVFHGAGRFRWTMSERYLTELIDIIYGSGYFQNASLLVNSAQGRNLERIADFFRFLIRTRPALKGRLTSGFDLYPFLPPVIKFPVLTQIHANVRRVLRNWDAEVATNLRRAHHPEHGFRIEVTEAQAEPFGRNQIVGNSLPHFQHVLAQCIDRILDPTQDQSVIRLFGIEYQLQTLISGSARPANHQILDLTRRVNSLSPRE